MANQGKYALDNLTYDIVTLLHEKSKSLEAFEKYIRDAEGNNEIRQLFERLRDENYKAIQELERFLGTQLQSSGGRKAA